MIKEKELVVIIMNKLLIALDKDKIREKIIIYYMWLIPNIIKEENISQNLSSYGEDIEGYGYEALVRIVDEFIENKKDIFEKSIKREVEKYLKTLKKDNNNLKISSSELLTKIDLNEEVKARIDSFIDILVEDFLNKNERSFVVYAKKEIKQAIIKGINELNGGDSVRDVDSLEEINEKSEYDIMLNDNLLDMTNDIIDIEELRYTITRSLEKLSKPVFSKVIRLRFGIEKEEHTLKQISEKLQEDGDKEISLERIHQIQKQALSELGRNSIINLKTVNVNDNKISGRIIKLKR